jgi:hypothetical protein
MSALTVFLVIGIFGPLVMMIGTGLYEAGKLVWNLVKTTKATATVHHVETKKVANG